MKQGLTLYLKLVGVSIRSQLQHRASFFMLTLASFIGTFVDILGIWVLFDRFKVLKGWTLPQLALIYGVVHMGFALAEGAARGFDTFNRMVRMGDFDRLLLRPCSTLIQVAARDFQLMRIGRLLQGLLVLSWGALQLEMSPLSAEAAVIAFAVIGTSALFYGLFVIQATLSFWLVETLELMNIATYGGVECGQYPISIYKDGFRKFFTFAIPMGCVAYYPVAALLQLEDVPFWIGIFAPVAGIVFLFFSFSFWNLGVSHYRSTGS